MDELIGKIITLDDIRYFALYYKKINNLDLCITMTVNPPPEYKILEVFKKDGGIFQALLYEGDDTQKIIDENYNEILGSIQTIFRNPKTKD